ncbi:MAG: vitamin B12 dependent-methionine synthase activation domain-containing protein [Acutalibacter sp.]|jgi:hypothetical protein
MDRREILRYLGASTSVPQLEEMIDRAEREVQRAASPRYLEGQFSLSVEQNGVTLGGTFLPSKTLAAHLKGCQEAFLVAFTLGPGVDSLIKRFELTEMPLVPVLQACAAAYTEEQADLAQAGMEQYASQRGLYLRPRYSPGYGDFPLSSQRFLFDALQVSKKIGITLTENYLMLPMKSITGVVGLSPDPSLCHVGKCMTCSAKDCPFRKATGDS